MILFITIVVANIVVVFLSIAKCNLVKDIITYPLFDLVSF